MWRRGEWASQPIATGLILHCSFCQALLIEVIHDFVSAPIFSCDCLLLSFVTHKGHYFSICSFVFDTVSPYFTERGIKWVVTLTVVLLMQDAAKEISKYPVEISTLLWVIFQAVL